MSDISLDLNKGSPTYNDWLVLEGDLALTSDAEAGGSNPVLQDILQALRTFLNEWYLDNTIGVPWFQQILVKNPDQETVDGLIRATILDRPGVLQLTSYSSKLNLGARTLTIDFMAQTTSGPVDYSGTVTAGNGS